MNIRLNYATIKNIYIPFFLLCVITALTLFTRSLPYILVIFIGHLMVFYQLLKCQQVSEEVNIKLIQSYLDKKLIFKIAEYLNTESELNSNVLTDVSEKILDYFLFSSVHLYKIDNQALTKICSIGRNNHKAEMQTIKTINSSLLNHKSIQEIQKFQIPSEVTDINLFAIPLCQYGGKKSSRPKKLLGFLAFEQKKDIELSKQEEELLYTICAMMTSTVDIKLL